MTDQHESDELTLEEYREILDEIDNQPVWRTIADKEMDYADGNQLDGELLSRQRELGIPPAIEDMISPSLQLIQGYESATRTDWRVTSNNGDSDNEVAEAINYRLNTAEREAKADFACSEAFRRQAAVGLGWVEVAKESDPFRFPYRCGHINRNEIHWDMKAQEHDLSDARWLTRQRWLRPERVIAVFPQHKDLIERVGKHGSSWWKHESFAEGGSATGLNNAWDEARAWTVSEERWYNASSKEICIAEVWYRRWVRVPILKMPDGRVVEFDENNMAHVMAVSKGITKPTYATIARVRRAFFLGGHKLYDGNTPYPHRFFPYVPFWGFREDSTGIPYGYVRGWKYAQDSLNSGVSKMRWGLSAARVERTKGAVDMSDSQFRRQVARVDADIVLNAEHMSRQGARFVVNRDFQLNAQQSQMLMDNRQAITRSVEGISTPHSNPTSGVQEQARQEYSNQVLNSLMDNFKSARSLMGEMLMAMIIEDLGSEQHEIIIEGDAVRPDKKVVINAPEFDPETGQTYLSNDVQRTRLKVGLEDVPSSNTYRAQQMQALTEAIKPLPQEYLTAAIPYLAALMDLPFKKELVEAFRAVGQQQSPEQIQQQIEEAKQQALRDAMIELKQQELELKKKRNDADVKHLEAKSVQTGVQASFAAMQAGSQVAQMPMIAPIADEVMKGAGYQRPTPAGDDPNFPTPSETAASNIRSPYIQGEGAQVGSEQLVPDTEVRKNTSPTFPPLPQEGQTGMTGIETANTGDNLP